MKPLHDVKVALGKVSEMVEEMKVLNLHETYAEPTRIIKQLADIRKDLETVESALSATYKVKE